jgi:hypothetical protein
MKFKIVGPFKLQKGQNGLPKFDLISIRAFWNSVSKRDPNLANACGCYIYANKAGLGSKPWYVGKAVSQSLCHEVFAPHKRSIYQSASANKKGTPQLFFIALQTRSGRYARPNKNFNTQISFLETLLIGASIDKNSKLLNIQKTKFLKEMVVPGFFNSPKRRKSNNEKNFASMIR